MSGDSALVLAGPKRLEFEPLTREPLPAGSLRVETLYSGISAGTELSQYRGTNPFMNRRWDQAHRVFREDAAASWTWPLRSLGYEEVGRVVETGADVGAVRDGDLVFGTWGHRTFHVLAEQDALARRLPQGADPRIGIFSHIGAVALNGVHDARIRIGELVVVFGLGVPGQIVMQAARHSGAEVIGVDPVAARRELALRLGAHRVLDPNAVSISDSVKSETGGRGADVCIEVSGAPAALTEAMRTVAYSSRVVALGFFQGEAQGLRLGDEFHHNRIELISSQISGVAPDIAHRWNKLRLWQTAVRLQHEGMLDLVPLISDLVPFRQAPRLFERLDDGDAGIMQAVLAFHGGSE